MQRKIVMLVLLTWLVGCRDLTQELPAGVQNSSSVYTPDGALGFYRGVLRKSSQVYFDYLHVVAGLTDEMGFLNYYADPVLAGTPIGDFDGRSLDIYPNLGSVLYNDLHGARTHAMLAATVLEKYAPNVPAVFRAEMYAHQAYAIMLLADLFCSGIPFGSIELDGDYTYVPGIDTRQAYLKAAALFDTAISLAGDSVRIRTFARIGKGRALLSRGEYAEAAAAVVGIPDAFVYSVPMVDTRFNGTRSAADSRWVGDVRGPGIADREGGNGLPFISAHDPRIVVRSNGKAKYTTDSIWVPAMFDRPWSDLAFVAASGIEARLIEAEVDLRNNGDRWLDILNALRTNGNFTVVPNAVDPSQPDTVWLAGSGGVSGLAPLVDPGDQPFPLGKSQMDVRVDLLFSERGFWLFLTGRRQGDLRRLIREYDRDPESVYPSGPYGGSAGEIFNVRYGSSVVVPVPTEESIINRHYKGCISGDA